MTPPPDIPEEAVERVALILEGSAPHRPTRRAREVLRASGALFLSDEEKRALIANIEGTTDTAEHIDYDAPWINSIRSARQKLEESLGPDRIRNG